ncbi:MAG: hypothetical protein ABI361_14165 [Nitrososphaera sp.]
MARRSELAVIMPCTSLCQKLGVKSASYRDGWRYCGKCEVFWHTSAVRCQCCNNKLRYKLTWSGSKERFKR